MKKVLLTSALLVLATASSALAGSIDDFAGKGFQRSWGKTRTVTDIKINSTRTENGSFHGQEFGLNVDSIMSKSGDFKSSFDPHTQTFKVWGHEGINKFAVQGYTSELNYDYHDTTTQKGSIHTVSTEGFHNYAKGYVIDADTDW